MPTLPSRFSPQTIVAPLGKAPDGKWYPLGMTAPTYASQTLTLSGNAQNNETFVAGGKTYTWKDTLTGAENQVKVAATATLSRDNAVNAVNRGPGDGTAYSAATVANTQVSAAAGVGDTMVVTALDYGEVPNGYATTETMANASWGNTTLLGGRQGTVNVAATITATAESTAEATAAAPAYTEGQDAPLSQDLNGNLRTKNPSVTQATSVIVPASTPQVIPIGAKEWTVTVLTGTATVNGAAACPAGFSDGSTRTLLNTVTILTAAASTAYVRWAT